ncbi:hypothetical protein AYY17_18165 [Morganella psychrotolerans]|uniref:Uncharacterized protein n=1 Tax=Morganella psychrotolerans TaxID=368603 RepID=A0A1B8HKK0_9GAMM|nr:hypothetical protein AYY17_18165 [Morganella psychrotolerans]
MRQCGDPHPCGNHLNQQQGVIHCFHLRRHTRRLQEAPPDIKALALYRVYQQRVTSQILRLDNQALCQRVLRCDHQLHLIIKQRCVGQFAVVLLINIRSEHYIQLPFEQFRLRIKTDS